jgi:hypothetical protein
MTFGERTLGSEAGRQLELLRYCCAPGLSVQGGAGRLLKAFRAARPELAGSRIVTYADLRWTPIWGSRMYESIGFRPDGRTKPTYDYVHPSQSNRRVSRIALQKHKLLPANPQFDASMTEEQMAAALGYARVWNSGSLRYALGG